MPEYQTIKEIKAYNQGQSAFHDGLKEEDCKSTGIELSAWLGGFNDAKQEFKQPNE